MFLFAVVIFYINALQICTTSDSVNSLLKYKIDLDRIGNDVENFFYDLTKDVLKKSEKFGYDYETDDEEEEKETIKNKIIKQKMKFNTTPSPINVIEDYTDTNNERKRRSIISEENFSAAVEKPNCNPIVFEDESLQDIKVEVKKLTEITRLLRDQQKILSKLNNSNDFSGEYDPQDILNMLQNFVKNREIAMPKDEKFKNLDKLKTEIHKAILALNQTNDVWKGEKQTELNMEKQIKQQKNDIDGLKKVVEQLLHQTKEKENGNVNMTEEIVGLPLFLTHPLQSVKKHSEQKIEHGIHFKKTNDSNIPMNKTPNVQIHQEKQEPPIKTESINKTKTEEIGQEKARSSSVEKEISKLFDTVEEPSKINLEDELEELEDKLNTVSKQKNLKKALLILRKLLKKEKKEKPAAKSLLEVDDDDSDDEDVVFLKRLQTAINVINSESGKTVPKQENEIEKRLKELQIAIDRLRPKDQFEADETNGAQKKGLPEDVKADKEPERLTVNQLKQLRNKIDELLRVEEGRKLQNKPITSSGINYDSPIMNFDSKKPLLPYPFWYRGPMGLPPLDYYGQHSPLPIDAGRLMPNDNPKYFDPQEVDMRSQFFQAPQFFPSGTSRELNYYPEDSIGYIVPQSGHYTTALDKNDFKKISKVNELKTEIYNLENILSTIDSTPYGDKSELTQLEQQIKDLKVIINSLTADKVPYLQPPISKTNYRSTRPKRSIEEYDDITSMLKKYVLEEEHKDRSSHYDELRKRLDKIRTQLEKETSSSQKQIEYWPFQQYIDNSYYKDPTFYKKQTRTILPHAPSKKEDVLTKIIVKIVEKVVAAIPHILGKLFGVGFEKIVENSYDYKYGVYDSNNKIQSVFYKLGIFGYIPMILLNILNAISTFCKILRKNKVFTNFIVPTLVVLLVSGAVVFLIWWLQPDDDFSIVNRIESDTFSTNSGNYLYNNGNAHHSGTDSSNYRSSYVPYYFYPTPYLRNYRNFDQRSIDGVEKFPTGYYRSYFDDGSRRV